MKQFDRQDASSLLIAFVAIAAIPLSVWLIRPRPLAADSLDALTALARSARQEEVLNQMNVRYEGASLNMEGPDPGTDPTARWQEIEDSIEQAGALPGAAQEIVRVAQMKLPQEWPCLAERGYLQDKPVWLVIGSSRHDTGFIAWACQPTADAIRQEKIEQYCTNVQTAVVSAEPPHKVLN